MDARTLTRQVGRTDTRRCIAIGAAAVMFALVFALRQANGTVADALALLYAVPIAVVAVELGLGAGIATAAFALGLVGVWTATSDTEIGLVGLGTRGVVYLAVGGVTGYFSDRMRAGQAYQAALLDSARERGEELREVIAQHELARCDVARALHEDAAQQLAGVLMGLRAVERELGAGASPALLEAVRADVDRTLRSLRELAVGLRPPVLDELGLRAGLERLSREAQLDGNRSFIAVGNAGRLAPELEVMVFRVAEDALRATHEPRRLDVRLDERDSALRVVVEGSPQLEAGPLTLLKARVNMLGGTLSAAGGRLAAQIPVVNYA